MITDHLNTTRVISLFGGYLCVGIFSLETFVNDFYPLYIYFLKYGAYFVKRRTFDLIEMHSIALLYIY